MKRIAVVVALAAVGVLAWSGVAAADEGDVATSSRRSALIGDQFTLTIEVTTAQGATVEIDPAAPDWNGIEVVRILSSASQPAGDRVKHTVRVLVAPFVPGDIAFSPVVTVIAGGAVTQSVLPPVNLQVVPTVGPGDPLELSPLAEPVAIGGAESPFLRPGIALAAVVVLALAAAGIFFAARALSRRPAVALEPLALEPVSLGDAEALMERDPAGAYRRLGALVRRALGDHYGFPAHALTTSELGRRMEAQGVDRWQARLVTGLLQECDAVVYAGYRPAPERCQADLTMAREIVEAT
jgi:hypothetical protein